MSQKRHTDEDALRLPREIEVHLASGNDITEACRNAGISDGTYYNWRNKFGGVSRSQLAEKKALEKENKRLMKIVAELELDSEALKPPPVRGECQTTLKESIDSFKPKA